MDRDLFFDELLADDAVADEILHRDYLQSFFLREIQKLRQARHASVAVHYFADDPRGMKPGEAGEVNGGLRVSGALQDASGARDERKYVSWSVKILGDSFGLGERARREGAFLRRDAGGGPAHVVDGDGEGRAVRVRVMFDHRREVEPLRLLARERHAD